MLDALTSDLTSDEDGPTMLGERMSRFLSGRTVVSIPGKKEG